MHETQRIKKNGLNVGPIMQRLAVDADGETTLLKLDLDTRMVTLVRKGKQMRSKIRGSRIVPLTDW